MRCFPASKSIFRMSAVELPRGSQPFNPVSGDLTASTRHSGLTRAQRTALALLRGYKIVFSPLFAGSCRFLPSCSEYAAEAIAWHGVLRGSVLAARRLARCHPFAAAGVDPVPHQHGRA